MTLPFDPQRSRTNAKVRFCAAHIEARDTEPEHAAAYFIAMVDYWRSYFAGAPWMCKGWEDGV